MRRPLFTLAIVLMASTMLATTPPELPNPLPPQLTLRRGIPIPPDAPQPPWHPLTTAQIDQLGLSPTLHRAMLASIPSAFTTTTEQEILSGKQMWRPTSEALYFSPEVLATILGSSKASQGDAPKDVAEAAIITQRDANGVDRTHVAYMWFAKAHPTGNKPRIHATSTTDNTTWSIPVALSFTGPVGVTYDQSGDPALAENAYSSGSNPKRVFLVGTTFNLTNTTGDNQISAWYADQNDGIWHALPPLHTNASSQHYFDDKPAVAVSWYSSSVGAAYVAFTRISSTVPQAETHKIWVYQFAPSPPAPSPSWDLVGVIDTGSFSTNAPVLVADPSAPYVYLGWLDWNNDNVYMKRYSLSTGLWDATKNYDLTGGNSSHILLSSTRTRNNLICVGAANTLGSIPCVSAQSMLDAAYNNLGLSIGVVAHRRKTASGRDAEVVYARFRTDLYAWDSAPPVVVSPNSGQDQFNGALDVDASGNNYLVTYNNYDRIHHPTYFMYRVKAEKLSVSGGRPEAETLVYDTASTCAESSAAAPPDIRQFCDGDASQAADLGSGNYNLGEFRDMWSWYGTWYCASVYVPYANGMGVPDIVVSRVNP